MSVLAISIDDFQKRARRRVPRLFFDYCDGGASTEAALERNVARLREIRMLPRGPRNIAGRAIKARLFGRDYAMPLGIAPIGLANLFWPGTDIALARAAKEADIPHVLSTAASTMLEDVAPAAGGNGFFQLYTSRDDAITEDLLKRAEEAGYEVLIVTIDVAMPGKRRRDLRNGFRLPMPMGPKFALQVARCPSWAFASLGQPVPRIVNLERYAPASGAQSLAAFMAAQISPMVDLDQIVRIRDRWKGKMAVKGILNPLDAVELAERGVDGVVVSNHGGRQLDSAPATIDALPPIVEAVGDRMTVMMDGGIRTGEDVAKALALGADFVFAARPFIYGMGATGSATPAIDILKDEFDRALAHLGCVSPADLGHSHLWPADLPVRRGGMRPAAGECPDADDRAFRAAV